MTEVVGSPERPLSPQQARAKFAACGAPASLWDRVMKLDRLDAAAALWRI